MQHVLDWQRTGSITVLQTSVTGLKLGFKLLLNMLKGSLERQRDSVVIEWSGSDHHGSY